MSMLTNPESKHHLMKELAVLDEQVKVAMQEEKEFMDLVTINEIKFARQEKVKQKVSKKDDYQELTKD